VNPNLTPQARLALSRERMRLAMRSPTKPQAHAANTLGLNWLQTLKSEPGTRIVLDALCLWWEQYPLRTIGTQLAQSFRTVLAPMAQRNPLGLVLVALVAGGLLTWVKPWRWMALPTILAGVLQQVIVKLVDQVPPSTWLDGLDALLRRGLDSNHQTKP
jgi:hypothetical protein